MVAVGSQFSALGFVDHLGTLGNLVGSVVTIGSLVAVVAVAFALFHSACIRVSFSCLQNVHTMLSALPIRYRKVFVATVRFTIR